MPGGAARFACTRDQARQAIWGVVRVTVVVEKHQLRLKPFGMVLRTFLALPLTLITQTLSAGRARPIEGAVSSVNERDAHSKCRLAAWHIVHLRHPAISSRARYQPADLDTGASPGGELVGTAGNIASVTQGR